MYQEDERVQTRRRQTDTAIQLAMSSRWEEAVSVNRSIIQLFPNDGDSHNRLGKALMELGRYNDAKKAYKKALELDPMNQIARKNLDRLIVLAKSKTAQADTVQVDPKLFIEETGKSAVTVLLETTAEIITKLNAGEALELRPQGKTLAAETPGNEFVGMVEPKLAARLLKLIEGGNEYAAAVTSLAGDECRIIIKETYQHPDLAGRPSFPSAVATEGLRPYTKGSLLRYESRSGDAERDETEEDDGSEEETTTNEWDSDNVVQEGHVRLNDAAAAEDVDDDDFDE